MKVEETIEYVLQNIREGWNLWYTVEKQTVNK